MEGAIQKGSIRSEQFDDVYFSAEDGLAETRHVFLAGNNLPESWKNRERFTIAETGFGTGLNFLATWTLFEETAKPGQIIDYISFEKYPLSTKEIKETLLPWVGEFSGRLEMFLRYYPLRIPGFHRIVLNERVSLTLIFDDVNEAMAQLVVPCGVDAWFLDGFTPAKNPEMWSETVFKHMARLSAPGASVATFTAAGFVRRGLEKSGFKVQKMPGFGQKRDMVYARYNSDVRSSLSSRRRPVSSNLTAQDSDLFQNDSIPSRSEDIPKHIAIIGGGLAGAACAYVLKSQGFEPVIYEKGAACAGAVSSKSTGLFNPRISAHKTVESDYYTAGFAQMVRQLESFEDVGLIKCGYVHLMTDGKKEGRFQETIENWRWHENHMKFLTADEASKVSGICVDQSALYLPDSGCVSLGKLYERYMEGVEVRLNAEVIALDDLEEDAVILACYGAVAADLGGMKWLPAHSVRGQGTLVKSSTATRSLKTGLCYGGHITPEIDGTHAVGSTYQKWLYHTDILDEDHEFNLARLAERVPSLTSEPLEIVGGRAALRTATKDRFPVVGPVPDKQSWLTGEERNIPNLYISAAHGSHGIVSTIAAAYLLADIISGRPYSLPAETVELLRADRFLKRDKRKFAGGFMPVRGKL